MRVAGLTKVRNEAHILGDTLDNWSQYVDAVFLYDDCSTDNTREIACSHRIVEEVISSDFLDPDRERAEWYCRQVVFNAAKRFKPEWVVYFDGDEWLYDFDMSSLDRRGMVACRSFDLYITPEDVSRNFREREMVGPAWEYAPYFYRTDVVLGWHMKDQRNATLLRPVTHTLSGSVLHLGKGISEEKWERKCRYYSEVFGPKYREKWEQRKGKPVQSDYRDVYGKELIPFSQARRGVGVFPRKGLEIVK
jgi:glycosyltransferase involved in cell wall biosynthesis